MLLLDATTHRNRVATEQIARAIFVLREQRVLLDTELAALYGVAPKVLLQAVKRKRKRFPTDFMMQMTAKEWTAVRSQFVTLEPGRGRYRKYLPYAFTEQGVAMQSSVINSDSAIAVNTQIMRTAGSTDRQEALRPKSGTWTCVAEPLTPLKRLANCG